MQPAGFVLLTCSDGTVPGLCLSVKSEGNSHLNAETLSRFHISSFCKHRLYLMSTVRKSYHEETQRELEDNCSCDSDVKLSSLG